MLNQIERLYYYLRYSKDVTIIRTEKDYLKWKKKEKEVKLNA